MIDLNYSLRIAYFSALSGIGVPVHYQELPPTSKPDSYIILRSITSSDASSKSSSDTETYLTVSIYTANSVVNSGLTADILAREVFNRVYPYTQFNLTIDGGQIVSTVMDRDHSGEPVTIAGKVFNDRHITFKHNIFQTADIS